MWCSVEGSLHCHTWECIKAHSREYSLILFKVVEIHYQEYVCENHVKIMWKVCEKKEPCEINVKNFTCAQYQRFTCMWKFFVMHVNFFPYIWTSCNVCEFFFHTWNNLAICEIFLLCMWTRFHICETILSCMWIFSGHRKHFSHMWNTCYACEFFSCICHVMHVNFFTCKTIIIYTCLWIPSHAYIRQHFSVCHDDY